MNSTITAKHRIELAIIERSNGHEYEVARFTDKREAAEYLLECREAMPASRFTIDAHHYFD